MVADRRLFGGLGGELDASAAVRTNDSVCMHYHVSGEHQLLEITVGDGLTKEEVFHSWDAIAAHPIYPQATAGLVLFGRDMKWDVTGREMSEMSRRVQRLKPLKWAFVTRDPLSYGMTRMFGALAEGGGTYRTFDNEAEARKWLRAE